MKIKITHLTTVHYRYDTRIFLKECTSLAKQPHYSVALVVAHNKADEIRNNVHIYSVGASLSRLNRIFKKTRHVLQKALSLNSDIYHIHDPELLPAARKLKKTGKKVIFDAHEDLPQQIKSKPYLNFFAKKILSCLTAQYEKHISRQLDLVVAATPFINNKFKKISNNSCNINNYPIIKELAHKINWQQKKNEICYIGGITAIRGIKEIIKALDRVTDCSLNLAGNFGSSALKKQVQSWPGWQKVNEIGFINRNEVKKVLARSQAGLVTFHPKANHINAQPNKMFEYMSSGVAVIASNFKKWREVVEKNSCGICVDPLRIQDIADAINYIFSHPKEAEQMGKNGRRAVAEKYNWGEEEKKLLSLYENLSKK